VYFAEDSAPLAGMLQRTNPQGCVAGLAGL